VPDPFRLAVLVSALAVGGAEQVLIDLLARLDRRTFEIRLGFLQADPGPMGREIQALGLTADTGLRAGRLDPLCPWRLWRFFHRHRIELVLGLNHLDALLYGLPAAKAAGAAFVNWEHETERTYRFHDLTMAARRLVLRHADAVVAVAEGHADYVARADGLPRSRVTVIHNGADPARSASPLSRAEARARLDLGASAPVAVQVAALRPDKAHEVMLTAFAQVRQRLPQAVLLLAGDGPCRAGLETLAARLGLGDGCRFLGLRRDVGDILAAADLLALSSDPRQETLSVAVIEAMFAGLPVVATDVGSLAEIVIPGRTGRLVPPRRPELLAEALAELLADPGTCRRLGRAGRELALSRYDLRIMVAAFETLLGDLARTRRERRTR
jgi:glycosyltransferase involved in cell wall biosynthesis